MSDEMEGRLRGDLTSVANAVLATEPDGAVPPAPSGQGSALVIGALLALVVLLGGAAVWLRQADDPPMIATSPDQGGEQSLAVMLHPVAEEAIAVHLDGLDFEPEAVHVTQSIRLEDPLVPEGFQLAWVSPQSPDEAALSACLTDALARWGGSPLEERCDRSYAATTRGGLEYAEWRWADASAGVSSSEPSYEFVTLSNGRFTLTIPRSEQPRDAEGLEALRVVLDDYELSERPDGGLQLSTPTSSIDPCPLACVMVGSDLSVAHPLHQPGYVPTGDLVSERHNVDLGLWLAPTCEPAEMPSSGHALICDAGLGVLVTTPWGPPPPFESLSVEYP